jgi:Transposase DDE domain
LGMAGESESALCAGLWEYLPQSCLLLLDRLYGQGPMLEQLQSECSKRASHFVVRVRQNLATKVLERYADGSALVEVRICQKGKPRVVLRTLQVREIMGRVWSRRQSRWVTVRLWTSLRMDQAQGVDLVGLYARRWDQEVFYKELKLQLAGGELLQSHTAPTAAQEIIALLIASSLLAEERLAVAALAPNPKIGQAGALRISFTMCLYHSMALWITLDAARGLLDEATQAQLIVRVRTQIAQGALAPRRARSCDRKVRQPIKKWPRMISPFSLSSPILHEIVPIA